MNLTSKIPKNEGELHDGLLLSVTFSSYDPYVFLLCLLSFFFFDFWVLFNENTLGLLSSSELSILILYGDSRYFNKGKTLVVKLMIRIITKTNSLSQLLESSLNGKGSNYLNS